MIYLVSACFYPCLIFNFLGMTYDDDDEGEEYESRHSFDMKTFQDECKLNKHWILSA